MKARDVTGGLVIDISDKRVANPFVIIVSGLYTVLHVKSCTEPHVTACAALRGDTYINRQHLAGICNGWQNHI